jgi:hypothetical protein
MLKEYKFLQDFSNKNFIQEMMEINDSMQEILEALDGGLFQKDDDFKLSELNQYIISLIEGQRLSLGRTKEGSWALVPNDDGMDSDARVEFIFKPTYIATATLSRYLLEYPEFAISIQNFNQVLHKGMIFCTYRKLQGHGFEGDAGAIEALKILSLGKIPLLLNSQPNFCPELLKIIEKVANDMAKRLQNGTAKGSWGEDYSEGFRDALETLFLLNNKDFMEKYNNAKIDNSSIGREELPW